MLRRSLLTVSVIIFTIAASTAAEPEKPIRIVLVGDSTVATYLPPPKDKPTLTGWGQVFGDSFSDRATVLNRAKSGRSTRSFINEGLWKTALADKGDYIFIQFGHNDSHVKDGKPAVDPATDFQTYLRQYIDEARAAGAKPILITPVARRTFEDGKTVTGLQPYADAMFTVGKEKDVPVIDLHAAAMRHYGQLGDAGSADLSVAADDRTHFSAKGARAMAQLVAEALPTVVPELRPYLKSMASPSPASATGSTILTDAESARLHELGSGEQIWPQWHGPNRDCFVGGSNWPKSLDKDHLKLLWHVDLGPGYPGPIVAEDRVFVAETKDQKAEIVRALDRKTGRELWKSEWSGAMSVAFMAKRNGDWIRSTPACDGHSLFVGGMRDVLVCLDAKTGKERWRLDFVKQFKAPLPDFGFVCSPLVVGEFVYIQAGAGFCKVNKQSGKVVWRVLTDGGGMYGSAFSSPVYRTLCGKPQLIVQTRTKLVGVEPESGKVLWSQDIPAMLGMNIVTPVADGDRIYTSSYGGGSCLLEIKRVGEDFQVTTLWKTSLQGYMSTPVIIDGHAYLHLRSQKFTCIELKTGKQTWTTTERYGQYWSLAAQKDRILALDQTGQLFLIHATPQKFDLLDSRKVSEDETWGHLAVCGDQVFVRELKGISAYDWR